MQIARQYGDASAFGRAVVALQNFFLISLGLGMFNLLPGLPLDGGHILRAGLSVMMSRGRAGWIAGWCGIVIAAGIGVYAMITENGWGLLVALFIAVSAHLELKRISYE